MVENFSVLKKLWTMKKMQDEMKLPKGKKVLENMWIFRMKQDANSTSPWYKAILVVKDFR